MDTYHSEHDISNRQEEEIWITQICANNIYCKSCCLLCLSDIECHTIHLNSLTTAHKSCQRHQTNRPDKKKIFLFIPHDLFLAVCMPTKAREAQCFLYSFYFSAIFLDFQIFQGFHDSLFHVRITFLAIFSHFLSFFKIDYENLQIFFMVLLNNLSRILVLYKKLQLSLINV